MILISVSAICLLTLIFGVYYQVRTIKKPAAEITNSEEPQTAINKLIVADKKAYGEVRAETWQRIAKIIKETEAGVLNNMKPAERAAEQARIADLLGWAPTASTTNSPK